jgi:hypothetical protein
MKRIWSTFVACAFALASCSATTSSSTCVEYAAEVQDMIASGASADDLSSFVSETDEHVTRLISKDPENVEPCVNAVLEAMFTGAFDDLASFLDE